MQSGRHKQSRELAHWDAYGERSIRRQPSSKMERSGIELGMARKVEEGRELAHFRKEETRMTDAKDAVRNNMLTRRTIRRFLDRQIGEEELQTVLEAGLYAPSAGGRQGVLFAVSQNREVNEKLGRIKRANSHVRTSTDTVYISREQPSIADDPGIMNAFYDAPTVITLFVPKDFLYGPYDASAAAENMLLAAHTLGIGGCFIGSAWDSFRDPFGQEVLREWDVRTDYYAAVHVLLGYPKDAQAPKAKERREGRIIRR